MQKGDFFELFEDVFMKNHFHRVDDALALRKGRSGPGRLSMESAHALQILEFLRKHAKKHENKKKIEKLLEGGAKKMLAKLGSTTELEAYYLAKADNECSAGLTAELVKAIWPYATHALTLCLLYTSDAADE